MTIISCTMDTLSTACALAGLLHTGAHSPRVGAPCVRAGEARIMATPTRTAGCSAEARRLAILHAPKTGTTFTFAVIRAACPGLPPGWTPTCEALVQHRLGKGRERGTCGVVNATVPYGSGSRPFIRGYPRGSIEAALKVFREEPEPVCCSPFEMLLRGHAPTAVPPAVPATGLVVTMLRRGLQRVLSAFYAGLHVGGETSFGSERLRALYASVRCPAAFARFDGVSNCQSKLLLGCRCGSDCGGIGNASGDWTAAHDRALDAARRRVDATFFVGLTDAFDLSVRLLHRALGLPSAAVANLRPGVARAAASGSGSAYDERQLDVNHSKAWTPTQPWTACRIGGAGGGDADGGATAYIRWSVPTGRLEALDQAVYEHAAQRFWARARQAGLGATTDFRHHIRETPRLFD